MSPFVLLYQSITQFSINFTIHWVIIWFQCGLQCLFHLGLNNLEACKDAKVQQDESCPSSTDLPALYRPWAWDQTPSVSQLQMLFQLYGFRLRCRLCRVLAQRMGLSINIYVFRLRRGAAKELHLRCEETIKEREELLLGRGNWWSDNS